MRKVFLIAIINLFIYNSCKYPEMDLNELIYENDFEDENMDEIDGGGISYFNETNVIGDFNNDGFNLNLNDIGGTRLYYYFFWIYTFMVLGMEIQIDFLKMIKLINGILNSIMELII
jgi:hypothetical protein